MSSLSGVIVVAVGGFCVGIGEGFVVDDGGGSVDV